MGQFNRFMRPAATGIALFMLSAATAPPTDVGKPPSGPTTAPAATAPSTGDQPDAAPIAFETDFDAALARAKKENKILLLEFMTPTCGYCAKMMKTVYPKPEVKEFATQFVWVRIDQSHHPGLRLAQRFHGSSTPMYIAVGHDGASVFFKQSGAMSAAGFLQNMSILSFSNDEYLKVIAAESNRKLTPSELLARVKGNLVHGHPAEGKADLEKIIIDDPTNNSGAADDALIILGQIDLASSSTLGNNLGIGRWMQLIKNYPTADRAPDAVWYLAKAFRATRRTDLLAKMTPFLKNYPENVDAAACYTAINEKPETQ